MALTLLIGAQLAGLLMIPLGLPGLWLMLGAGVAHQLLVVPPPIGAAIGLVGGLAAVAEVLEFTLTARYTKRYGGSKRAGWGALLGGLVGAFMGVPIPILGSVIGAFGGSFLGALLAEYSVARNHGRAGRAAWGSLVGKTAATVAKTGLGLAMAVILVVRAW